MIKTALVIAIAGGVLLVAVVFVRGFAGGVPEATPVPLEEPQLGFAGDGAYAERFAALLRTATVSTDDGPVASAAFGELHALLRAQFPRVHETLRATTVNDWSLIYDWQGTDPALEPILLLAHLDVVPAAGDDWTYPPFGGVIAGGHVWGRGAMDDKLALFGILGGAEHLLGRGFAPRRSVFFAFGHDEEKGGEEGARVIAERFASRGLRFALVLDEGLAVVDGIVPGLARPAAMIGIAEKGYVSVELVAAAPGGHSSMPPPSTAVGIVSAALVRLEQNPFPGSLDSPAGRGFEVLAPHMGLGPRISFANRWLFERLLVGMLSAQPSTNATIRTTTAATMFEGGIKDNVLPPRARAVVNFRILPGQTREDVIEYVRATIDDPRITVRAGTGASSDPSPVSSADDDAFERLRSVVKASYPESVVAPGLVLGATDSRYFTELSDHVYRFTPMVLGPDDPARVHGVDERQPVGAIRSAVAFYATLVRTFGGE